MSDRLEAAVAELVEAIRAEVVPPEPPPPPRLLTIDEARIALGGIARSTIYELINAGRLRTIEIGRRRLVPSGAIAEIASADR